MFDFCPQQLTLYTEKTLWLNKELRKCNEVLLCLLTSDQDTPAAETMWGFDRKSSTALDHAFSKTEQHLGQYNLEKTF